MDKFINKEGNGITVVPESYYATIRINTGIEEPHVYEDILNLLDTARETDIVHFKINTLGGYASSMLELRTAMLRCKGHLIGEISGYCCSAGTAIFLSCDDFIVNPHVTFMIHNMSYGVIGKEYDIKSQVDFTNRNSEAMVKDIYQGFLNEQEIERVLRGDDIYLTAEEVGEHLEARNIYFEKLNSEATNSPEENTVGKEELLALITDMVDDKGLSKLETKNAIKELVEPFGIKVSFSKPIDKFIEEVTKAIEAL